MAIRIEIKRMYHGGWELRIGDLSGSMSHSNGSLEEILSDIKDEMVREYPDKEGYEFKLKSEKKIIHDLKVALKYWKTKSKTYEEHILDIVKKSKQDLIDEIEKFPYFIIEKKKYLHRENLLAFFIRERNPHYCIKCGWSWGLCKCKKLGGKK